MLGSDIEYPLRSNALSAKSVLGGRVALTVCCMEAVSWGDLAAVVARNLAITRSLCAVDALLLVLHVWEVWNFEWWERSVVAEEVPVRATLPPSTLFADRALLCRGYSISESNALVETVSKYKGLH